LVTVPRAPSRTIELAVGDINAFEQQEFKANLEKKPRHKIIVVVWYGRNQYSRS